MKKLFVALFVLSFGANVLAEEVVVTKAPRAINRNLEFKVDPLPAIAVGYYSGQVNYRANKNVSVGFRAKYYGVEAKGKFSGGLNKDFFAFNAGGHLLAVGPQVHYFPGSNQDSGIYLGGALTYVSFGGEAKADINTNGVRKIESSKVSDSVFAASIKIGYQWTWESGLVISSEFEPMTFYKNGETAFVPYFSLLSLGVAV